MMVCQLSLSCTNKRFRDGLTSDITRAQSDGFDLDQYFVLFQFWDGNLFENYVFTLALRLSIMQGSDYVE